MEITISQQAACALAGTAWNGFLQLPKFGTYHVLEAVERWRMR